MNKKIKKVKGEQKFAAARDYIDNIIKSMIDALIVVDPDGRIKTINKATTDLLGYKEEELFGRSVVAIFAEEEEEEEEAIIVSLKDITERVESRKQLEVALEKAQEGERMKSLFMANMSHEIRTPLNAIMGFTNLIEMSTRNLVSEEEKGFFDIVKKSGTRLLHTVHEILDISQIEAGTYNLYMEHLDLCTLVKNLVQEFEMIATQKGLELVYEAELETAIIEVDQLGISQAISNIIDNAIKYTDQGKITVLLEQKPKHYVLSIRDTGIGIAEDYLNKLYEVFSQESEGYTKKYQGIGLGMSIAKRHLDLNHIAVKVESTKGVGTTFTLTFPEDPSDKSVNKRITEKRVEKEEVEITSTAEPIEKPLVLLVEDDPDTHKLMGVFLRDQYEIDVADSVAGAKQKMKKNSPELVLLDLSLVGNEDGLDLVRWMRKTKTWKKTPVVATTAHAFTKDKENCIVAGCNDYLSKPMNREKLLEKISKLV
ncbi:MAG: response regulator [Candidatus Marinimicrobia bacterium]|nr:response regulator [Candidatus Neomarinimicrobiota bacterium]